MLLLNKLMGMMMPIVIVESGSNCLVAKKELQDGKVRFCHWAKKHLTLTLFYPTFYLSVRINTIIKLAKTYLYNIAPLILCLIFLALTHLKGYTCISMAFGIEKAFPVRSKFSGRFFNPIRVGGGLNQPALFSNVHFSMKKGVWRSKISWLFLIHYELSENQKKKFGFSQCFEVI